MFLVYMYSYCLYSHTIDIFVLEHTRIIQLSVIAVVSKTHKAKAVDPVSVNGSCYRTHCTCYFGTSVV